MEPFQLPGDEEIGAAYDEGKEAVIVLFHRTVGQLATRVQALEDRVSKTVATVASHRQAMDYLNRLLKACGRGVERKRVDSLGMREIL